MRKIRNPFISVPGFGCFGCCPSNPLGLHLQFWLDGDEVVSYWQPQASFQGWGNILHGGVQTALLDEIAGWAVLLLCQTAGVTSRMEIKFLKPISVQGGTLTLRSRIHEVKRRIVVVEGEIYNSAEELCAQSLAHFFTFSADKAPEHLHFPGMEEFFEPEENSSAEHLH